MPIQKGKFSPRAFKKRQQAKKDALKRRTRLATAKAEAQNRKDSILSRMKALEDPEWVKRYIARERAVCENNLSQCDDQISDFTAEIAGLDIEIARRKKELEKLQKRTEAA